MFGAIAGDIIGSVYEGKKAWQDARTPHFEPLFHPRARATDDTVLTVAVAEWILRGGDLVDLAQGLRPLLPRRRVWGNVPAVGGIRGSRSLFQLGQRRGDASQPGRLRLRHPRRGPASARRTAEVTHNHPEGIRGSQATAAAVYLARTGSGKEEIRDTIERKFGYDLSARLDDIRPGFQFDVSCLGTVPPAILAFLESTDYEHAVRLAVSLGGDADTLACIAGGIAQAYYGGVPGPIREQAWERLDDDLRAVIEEFEARFPHPR